MRSANFTVVSTISNWSAWRSCNLCSIIWHNTVSWQIQCRWLCSIFV